MTDAEFREAVREMQANEQPEDIYPLTQDRALVAGMLAWRSVPVHPHPNAKTSDPWGRVRFDLADFARAAGVGLEVAQRLFEVLRRNRLIYPDGTIHQLGRQYARALMVKALQRQGKPG